MNWIPYRFILFLENMPKIRPRFVRRLLRSIAYFARFWEGVRNQRGWTWSRNDQPSPDAENPLRTHFNKLREGPGFWKWNHYFEIYHRHLNKFRGREVHVLEIGIYSGGSLKMWKEYFGNKCHVYGVDIEESCKACAGDSVTVFIGDQADRSFWKRFKESAPKIDVVIDDGGHAIEQQIVSFEELLPFLQPGGVYICEDIHGPFNGFASYLAGFIQNFNSDDIETNPNIDERRLVCKPTTFQSVIRSASFYPFIVAIERHQNPPLEFVAPKRGTIWADFLK